jgi:hypothetical protein
MERLVITGVLFMVIRAFMYFINTEKERGMV